MHLAPSGLAHLADLPSLYRLDLSDSDINDDTMESLTKCQQLNSVDLRKTNVTREGIARLRAALPNCHVEPLAANHDPCGGRESR
jgi:Leucine-rich repeat (LRR) protein